MDKEQLLDVNGFSAEYDVPVRKRVRKYRMAPLRDSSRTMVSVTDRLQSRSDDWRADIHRKQVITAIVGAIVFALVVAASVYLTFGVS